VCVCVCVYTCEMKSGFRNRGLARASWSGIESGRGKEKRLPVM